MAKKQPEHGLRLTQGTFQLAGIVTGVQSNNFYVEKDIPNSKNKVRTANFGVKYDVYRDPNIKGYVDTTIGKTVYPTVQGFTRDVVYFSKKTDNKTETKSIPWAQRLEFASQNPDWRVIGVNVGLEKGEDGRNIKEYLTEFDAAKTIKDKLKDDMSVFVRGNLEFRSYTNKQGETKRFTNFAANQISLCADVDFEEEGFEAKNNFEQEIVYTSIEKETEDDKPTGRFILNAYVISYNAIEPVSFVVTDSKFANLLRKNLKPYNSIKVHGKIEVSHVIEEVVEDSADEWGDSNPMDNRRVNTPTKRELVVTGASPATISTEDYTEESVSAGIKKLKAKAQVIKNFGEKKEEPVANNDDWGTPASDDSFDEEPW
jgi:hypothetical protein